MINLPSDFVQTLLGVNMLYWVIGLLLLMMLPYIFSRYDVVKTDFSDKKKKNATVCYYLPQSLIKIKATAIVAVGYDSTKQLGKQHAVVEQRFAITTEMVADTRDLLALNHLPNVLAADELKFLVNTKGLLETVEVTTEDKTPQIVTVLTKAPKEAFATSGSRSADQQTTVKIKEYIADFELLASEIDSNGIEISWDILVINEQGVDESPKKVSAGFKVSCSDGSNETPTLESILKDQENEIGGILTRPLKNVLLQIEPLNANLSTLLQYNVVVADTQKIVVMPISRTPFVKSLNKIGIKDGMVVSYDINRPSSIEGFVSIPINIMKAIVAIPAQLIKFRYDNTKSQQELELMKLSYERALLDSQKFALSKEAEITKAKQEAQKTNEKNETDLHKLKTSLDEAIKKQTEMQKTIEELSRQIASPKKEG